MGTKYYFNKGFYIVIFLKKNLNLKTPRMFRIL